MSPLNSFYNPLLGMGVWALKMRRVSQCLLCCPCGLVCFTCKIILELSKCPSLVNDQFHNDVFLQIYQKKSQLKAIDRSGAS